MAIKDYLQDSKIKPGPINQLKTIKTTVNTDWSDHRHNTNVQNKCI